MKPLFFILILVALLLTPGCLESNNIITPPFTEPQFYAQVTDLNYSKVKAGDYNNLGLIFDGNTLTTTSLLTDVNWCVGEKDANAVPQWDVNANCYVKATLSGGGGSWFDSLPYSKSLAEYVFAMGWMGQTWDNGFNVVAVDTNLETQGHTFWLSEDENISTISVKIASNNTSYGDINVVVYDITRSTGYPNNVLCWTNTTKSGSVSANVYNDWNFASGSCKLSGGFEYAFQMYNESVNPVTNFFQFQYLDNLRLLDGYSNLGREARIFTTNGTSWTRSTYTNSFLITFEDGNYSGVPLNGASGASFGQYGVTWWSPNYKIMVSEVKLGVVKSGSYTNTSGLEIIDVNGTVIAQSLNSYEFANYPTSLASPIAFYFDDVVLDANHGYVFRRVYLSGTANGVGIPAADLYNFDANVVKLKGTICGDFRCGYPYNGSVNWSASYRHWVNPITVFFKLYMGDVSSSVSSGFSGVGIEGLSGGLDSGFDSGFVLEEV